MANKQGDTDWNKTLKFLLESEQRNNYIIKIVKENSDKKILILTPYVAHVNFLKKQIMLFESSVDYMCGKKKTYNDSKILIGSISKLGTGFDEASSCANYNGKRIELIILCGATNDPGLLEQNVGRILRSDFPIVYDLVDSSKICINHWKNRYKWYVNNLGIIE